MKVKVIKKYHGYGGERPVFPTFVKGTKVFITGEMDEDFAHWYPCEINGYETFIPESFICGGLLARDYNPTELRQEKGDILEVQEIVNAWLVATNADGRTGWIAAESVVSTVTSY